MWNCQSRNRTITWCGWGLLLSVVWALLPSTVFAQSATCTQPNLLFLLDKASRMNSPSNPSQNKWNKARLALGQVSTTLNSATRQGLATFETNARVRITLRANAFSSISTLLFRETTTGNANHVRALGTVRTYLLQALAADSVPNRPTAVILFSDGTSNDGDPSNAIRALRNLTTSNGRKFDVKTYVVGFNPGSNLLNLQRWALVGGTSRVYLASQINSLITQLRTLLPKGTTEVCDGKDNDCDGQVDESLTRACKNSCRTGTQICQAGKWGACSALPPSPEVCNGVDDDCDGQTDEGLTRACANACGKGTETCISGRYQRCTAPQPAQEVCDGKDNDCDGLVDENGCTCTNGQTRPCGSDTGECTKGTQTCTNGVWSRTCSGTNPSAEVCDGKDNDCDGLTDEGLTRSCSNACGTGTETCSAGKWVNCSAPKPVAETCDARDNDCDGLVDEGCQCRTGQFRSCGIRTGACRPGNQVCLNGRWDTRCFGSISPRTEVCDGIDNDCDGQIDETLSRTCSNACGSGSQTCNRGRWGACSAPSPGTEVCDGKDNDCDGLVDENGCSCTNGQTRSCGTNAGECKAGTQTCTNGQWSTTCTGQVPPTRETCDGKDNDCDGTVDEGCACRPGQTRACGTNTGVCQQGTQRCVFGRWEAGCAGSVGPSAEVCDGKDNDCDGQTDENGCQCTTGQTRSCGGTSVGECKLGTQTCTAGNWGVCVGVVDPKTETCDNKDNDCDGQVDEGVTQACKTSCGTGTQTCKAGKFGTCTAPPPSPEVCDGKDNDCDGLVDENGCQCSNGQTRVCGGSNVGECKTGTQTCLNGQWGLCLGFIDPKPEICDGKDNDCDGKVDETGCQCTTGQTRPCGGSAVGECKLGKQTCTAGQWGACIGFVDPKTEICDGKDNDCDGQVDEGITQACKTACGAGTQTCQNGKLSACSAPTPSPEICDGKDNDCDGQTDEGCQCTTGQTRPCGGSAVGECKLGTQNCTAGQWGACVGFVDPQTEICDGKDNDCDGQTDEGITQACKTACGPGTQTCTNGNFGPCSAPTPSPEICDGKDNDCDGQVDEGCQCQAGETRPCGANPVGECKPGIETCANGKWGACVGEVKPSPETCDGKDNNCDGQVDENCSCKDGEVQPCGTNVGLCGQGTQTCSGGKWGACVGETKPVPEVCDGKDNDCDGQVDEELNRVCSTTCGSGSETCQNGRWDNCTAPQPDAEVCDGKDNNCNGLVDENCECKPGETRTCGSSQGVCKPGVQRCENGRWGATCEGGVLPQPEVCNNDDDDCDGQVDNGATCPNGQSCVQGVCEGEIIPQEEPPGDGGVNDGDEPTDAADGNDSSDTTDVSDSTDGGDGGDTADGGDAGDASDQSSKDTGGKGDIDPAEYQLAGGCGCQVSTPSLPLTTLFLCLLLFAGIRRRSR